MLASIITRVGAAVVVLVCGYAVIAGSWRERFGAIIYLTAYLIALGFGVASTRNAALYMLAADLLCIPGFYIASWKSRHPWPLWALIGQVISVVCEVITLTGLFSRNFFLAVESGTGFGVLLAILIGTVAYRTRRRSEKAVAARPAS